MRALNHSLSICFPLFSCLLQKAKFLDRKTHFVHFDYKNTFGVERNCSFFDALKESSLNCLWRLKHAKQTAQLFFSNRFAYGSLHTNCCSHFALVVTFDTGAFSKGNHCYLPN